MPVRRIRTALLAFILAITAVVTPNGGATADRDLETVAIWRVFVDDHADVHRLTNGDFDLLEASGDGHLFVVGEAGVADDLRRAGFRIERDRVLSAAPGVEAKMSLDGTMALAQTYFGGYRTVDEHIAHLNSVAGLYPDLTTLVDYGDSWRKTQGLSNGNDLYAICITNKQAGDCALNPNSAKPRAVIQAAIHARELQTSEVAWRLIDELTQNYGSDADITHMLDTTEVWVIPVVNPDGREIVESGGNSPYLQRKNANNSVGNCSVPPSSSNQHGVDLNRNATYGWGGVGTSTNPCSAVYRGTSSASEPEQQALETLFGNLWLDRKGAVNDPAPITTTGTFITIHSYGNLLLLPPGIGGVAPNDAQLRALAFRMSHYNGYRTGTGPEILYGVSGATDDHVYFTLGVPGFTYELSPSSGSCSGFTPAYSCVDSSIWPTNRDALMYSIKAASAPYITPRGPTTTTVAAGGPVEAGNPLAISATVNDNAFGNAGGSYGRPTAQTVTAAQYFIDSGPTQGGTPIPMGVSDGSFNETNEGVQATIDTTGLAAGEHVALIRGQNSAGFWGPITAVSFSVTESVDDPPTANPQSTGVVEDTPTVITLTGSDPEGGTLTFAITSTPSNGSLSGTAPNVTYTPTTGYVGNDSFTFTVDDGTTTSPPATVSITVTEFNVAPVADDASVAGDEDSPIVVALTGSDDDGDSLTFSVTSGPSNGSLGGAAPNLTYTPDANFNGGDSFTFVANDGTVNSATATIDITIDAVNDAPVAGGSSIDTLVDTSVDVTLTASDVDGDALTYAVTSGPANGTLTGTAPNLTYTPDAGYIGADQFDFAADDGAVGSNTATISIDVSDVVEGPVFQDDFEADLGWAADPNGTDTATTGIWERGNPQPTNSSGPKQLDTTTSGSNALVTGIVAGSSVGVNDVDNGVTSMWSPEIVLPSGLGLELSFDYYLAHTSNSSTADFFRMTVIGATNSVVVEELGATNDDDGAWQAANVDISAFEGQTVRLLIEASDASNGSIVEAAVDTLLINGVRPPSADDQSVSTAEDTSVGILLTGSDPAGDPLTFDIQSGPSNGSLGGTAPNLTYEPDTDFNGVDSFTFTVDDGTSTSAPATVSIDVTAVNDAPTTDDVDVTTQQDSPTGVTLIGDDVDGDPLTFITSNGPSNGTLTGTASNLTYTPDVGFQGSDGFDYSVSDGSSSVQATVSITVTPVAQGGTVFFDDFESDPQSGEGWVTDPDGDDGAVRGLWEVANPQGTSSSGTKQRNDTTSGVRDLVTDGRAGSRAGNYDVDRGTTSVRSPDITLPSGLDLELTFDYYFSHRSNSSSADFLRVTVVGNSSQVVFQELGASNDDDAVWATFSGSLDQFAGQTVYLLIEAADASNASLVEAALDDVRIEATAL